MARQRLTPAFIQRLAVPAERPQAFHYDVDVPTLAVRVTAAGGKSYVVNMWSRAWRRRICYTIGAVEQLPLGEARILAREVTVQITHGEDPIAGRRKVAEVAAAAARDEEITLTKCYQAYITARKKLAERTRYDYAKLMTTYLEAWAALPLSKITKDMIEQRHAEIGRTSPERANYTMRFLRALFNFAQERYEVNGEPLVPVNPVTRLSRARAWYPERRRSSYIKPHELAAWFAGVEAVQSEAGRAYLKLVLLTGLRKNEALKLAWRDVDLEGRTLRVPRTKNGRPHELPLSDYLFELLDGRREIAKASPWVFPGLDLKCAMVEPKRSIEQAIARGAPAFTSHDLRRTFATIVSGYLERSLSVYEIKRLLNHATQDVTAGYVQHDLEHLRPAMQAVTDFVLRAAAVRPSAEVVALEARRPLIDPRGTVNAA